MESSPPSAEIGCRALSDLSTDVFARCTSFLSVPDVCSLAISSKSLRLHAYSDAVWHRLFRDTWPNYCISSGDRGTREDYIARHTALRQFKYRDPKQAFFFNSSGPASQILFAKDYVYMSQGQHAVRLHCSNFSLSTGNHEVLRGHNARITCMRLFPISEASFFRGEEQEEDVILATSSSDRTIRLWWKGHPQRCFKGHTGPVNVLADSLLGVSGRKLLASGGEDCTVRLWSVGSERVHRHLVTTYHGHEKSISFLSIARHKTSLLVSISRDSRVRVWDTNASSSTGSSSCVGMTSVPGPPVGMKCYDSLCYIASGTTVTAIDLRTMRSIATVANHSPNIYSFEMLPTKWLLCTGGEDKAMLWDTRKSQTKPCPVSELEGHRGPVKCLHMDSYKIITGGPSDDHLNVWETDTSYLVNVLEAFNPLGLFLPNTLGFSALAVDRCRIVTSNADQGFMMLRDFSECSIPISSSSSSSSSYVGSKFWEYQNCSDD